MKRDVRLKTLRGKTKQRVKRVKREEPKISKECYIIKSFKEMMSAQTLSSTNFGNCYINPMYGLFLWGRDTKSRDILK